MYLQSDIICLLDDEPSVLKAISRLLASVGLAATSFSDPVEFLERAKGRRMRLAVIDLKMPGLSGMQVLSALREISPETSVIVVTGETAASCCSEAMNGGAVGFFHKPFDDELFLQAVRSVVGE